MLFTEQETLSKEDIEKGAGARSAAAPAEQSAMAPQSPAAAAGSGSKVFFDVAVDGEVGTHLGSSMQHWVQRAVGLRMQSVHNWGGTRSPVPAGTIIPGAAFPDVVHVRSPARLSPNPHPDAAVRPPCNPGYPPCNPEYPPCNPKCRQRGASWCSCMTTCRSARRGLQTWRGGSRAWVSGAPNSTRSTR